MKSGLNNKKETDRRNSRSWFWVLLCIIGIYSTIPLARSVQKFVYNNIGREFFTYAVFFVIFAATAALLYLFIFRLKIKKISQYCWLLLSAGLCIYYTIQLRTHPEEAIHILEYGLLSLLIFRALSHRVRDWSIYITVVLSVSFIGTMDEFIQWMMPQRYWGIEDVKINTLAAAIFQLAVWKGIRPEVISEPVKKNSVMLLLGVATLNILFLGFCFSNTPDVVNCYTSISKNLSWLRSEEPMTEYGYKYRDPAIGIFYSRLSLEEIMEIDRNNGKAYGETILKDLNSGKTFGYLLTIYTPYTNPFLYEFSIHAGRLINNLGKLRETDNPDKKIEISNIIYRENLIIENLFKTTFRYSMPGWSDKQIKDLEKTAGMWKDDYTSMAGGKIITSFTLKTVWISMAAALIILWTSGIVWTRRLDS